jgi:hypothetical protein
VDSGCGQWVWTVGVDSGCGQWVWTVGVDSGCGLLDSLTISFSRNFQIWFKLPVSYINNIQTQSNADVDFHQPLFSIRAQFSLH